MRSSANGPRPIDIRRLTNPRAAEDEGLALAASESVVYSPPPTTVPCTPRIQPSVKMALLVRQATIKVKHNPELCADNPVFVAEATSHRTASWDEEFVDLFITAKLKDWDKDENGTFDQDELHTIMAELEQHKEKQSYLWIGVSTICLALIAMVVVIALLLQLSSSTRSATTMGVAMIAKRVNGSNVSLATTSPSHSVSTFGLIFAYNDNTDKWALSEQQLRDVEDIQISWRNGTVNRYAKLSIAYLRRYGSGPNRSADMLEITSSCGTRLQFLENMSQLMVKWGHHPRMPWQVIPKANIVRRLSDTDSETLLDLRHDVLEAEGWFAEGNGLLQGTGTYYGIDSLDQSETHFETPHEHEEDIYEIDFDEGFLDFEAPRGRRAKGIFNSHYIVPVGGYHHNAYIGNSGRAHYMGDSCRKVTVASCASALCYRCVARRVAGVSAAWIFPLFLLQTHTSLQY